MDFGFFAWNPLRPSRTIPWSLKPLGAPDFGLKPPFQPLEKWAKWRFLICPRTPPHPSKIYCLNPWFLRSYHCHALCLVIMPIMPSYWSSFPCPLIGHVSSYYYNRKQFHKQKFHHSQESDRLGQSNLPDAITSLKKVLYCRCSHQEAQREDWRER